MTGLGRVLIGVGLLLAALGFVLVLGGRLPWLGRLPGDLLVQRPGFTLYLPLGTCLLLSALVSLLFWLLNR